MGQTINKPQTKLLQVLYGQLARHADEGTDRSSRLAWASQLTGRSVSSFKDLTQAEARQLIDTVKGQLGMSTPARQQRHLDRDAARKAGTEGRRRNQSNESTMASSSDIARIQYVMDLIGWNQAQLDSWLKSTRSPLRNKASGSIRTLGDANRVYWALKGMAVGQGKWTKGRA